MTPWWLAVSVLGVLLVLFVAYIVVRHRRLPSTGTDMNLLVRSGRCCFCMKEDQDDFFCGACYRRMILRYAAILAGIFCMPVGVGVGWIVHLAAGTPAGASVFAGALASVLVYNVIVWTYVFVYMRDRVHWYFGFLGFGFSFDPRGIPVAPVREWRRLRLLLKQMAGAKRPGRADRSGVAL